MRDGNVRHKRPMIPAAPMSNTSSASWYYLGACCLSIYCCNDDGSPRASSLFLRAVLPISTHDHGRSVHPSLLFFIPLTQAHPPLNPHLVDPCSLCVTIMTRTGNNYLQGLSTNQPRFSIPFTPSSKRVLPEEKNVLLPRWWERGNLSLERIAVVGSTV